MGIHFSRERRSPERRAKKKAGRGKRRNTKAKGDKRKNISNSKRSKEQKKNIRNEKKKARKSKKSKQTSIKNNVENPKIELKKKRVLKKKNPAAYNKILAKSAEMPISTSVEKEEVPKGEQRRKLEEEREEIQMLKGPRERVSQIQKEVKSKRKT